MPCRDFPASPDPQCERYGSGRERHPARRCFCHRERRNPRFHDRRCRPLRAQCQEHRRPGSQFLRLRRRGSSRTRPQRTACETGSAEQPAGRSGHGGLRRPKEGFRDWFHNHGGRPTTASPHGHPVHGPGRQAGRRGGRAAQRRAGFQRRVLDPRREHLRRQRLPAHPGRRRGTLDGPGGRGRHRLLLHPEGRHRHGPVRCARRQRHRPHHHQARQRVPSQGEREGGNGHHLPHPAAPDGHGRAVHQLPEHHAAGDH